MKLYVNRRLIRRRLWVSVVYLVLAIVFLVGGFIISIAEGDVFGQYALSTPALLLGLFFWWRNQVYLARWGPRGRHEDVLGRALRGLDNRHHLLAYPDPGLPDYLLVGPMGVLVIVARATAGRVRCGGERWYHDEDRPVLLKLLSGFTSRSPLGDPGGDARAGTRLVIRRLTGRLDAGLVERLPVESLVVFSHPAVDLVQQGCSVTALRLRALRSHAQRLPKQLSGGEVEHVMSVLGPVQSSRTESA